MDIGGWLRGLGLGQYEAAFRDNKIDAEVLPQLTAEDLKDIGVAIVGDRRKMLTAIGELSASSAAPAPIAQPTTPAPAPSATDAAERRQLNLWKQLSAGKKIKGHVLPLRHQGGPHQGAVRQAAPY